LLLGGGFVAISFWVKFASHPAKNVELNAAKVSRLRRRGLIDVRAFLNEEVSALLASLFPAFIEPRSAPSPVIQLIKVREFRVIAKEFDQGGVASREQGEKVIGKLFS
jgi:hypothetical protein